MNHQLLEPSCQLCDILCNRLPNTLLIDRHDVALFRKISRAHGDRTTADDVLAELELAKASRRCCRIFAENSTMQRVRLIGAHPLASQSLRHNHSGQHPKFGHPLRISRNQLNGPGSNFVQTGRR